MPQTVQKLKSGIDYIGISVVFVCHDGHGRFLLNKRSQACRDEQGRWDFGGGQLEFGEEVSAAVAREAREEYGCEVQIEEVLYPPHTLFRQVNGVTTHWIFLSYIVRVDPTQVSIGDPHKIDEIGWFTLDNLPTPLHSAISKFLEDHRGELERYSKI